MYGIGISYPFGFVESHTSSFVLPRQGGDPRFIANYGMTAFPPGVNPGYMPPMMMQRYGPPGMYMHPMHPLQGVEGEAKEAPPTPGQEGGDESKPAPSPKNEQDIIESAKAALETAI